VGTTFAQTLVAVAGRSKSRGLNFSPYLNFSYIQNPHGVTYSSSIDPNADATAPTGWSQLVDITGISTTWAEVGSFSITGATAPEYRGSYHVYLRCKQTHEDAGDIKVRATFRPSTGSATLYTDEKPTLVVGSPHMIDLGIIEFGSGTSIMSGDEVESAQIRVEHWSDIATQIHMTYYDLILFPVDEWTGIYNTTTNDWEMSLYADTLLDIDATSTFRTQRAVLRRLHSGPTDPKTGIGQEFFVGEWTRQARGGPFLQANADQRLWFLFARGTTFLADFRPKFNVKVYRNSRYLTMRGDE
jgi:hypothetical protein